MATGQRTLQELVLSAAMDFERNYLAKQPGTVSAEIKASLEVLKARINELANGKGVLSASSKSVLESEISALESTLYRRYSESLRLQLEISSQQALVSNTEALLAAVGPTVLATSVGLATSSSLSSLAETGALTTVLLTLVFGDGILNVAKGIAESIMGRTSDGGINTRRRLRIFAREVSLEIQKRFRTTTSARDLLRDIDVILQETDWRVARLVETESMNAYRTSVAKLSEMFDVISHVKIIDFAEGHEATHPGHKCYEYARSNEYGLGKGIYPTTVTKIRKPHPQCRAILVPVIAERD